VSEDGKNFTPVATCKWAQDSSEKVATFKPVKTRFIRLEATEGYNGMVSAAEVRIYKKGSTNRK
jgi:hypothetical protein